MSVAWVGAGIAAVGTISQMSAAGDAADAQSQSAQQASMQQMMAQQQMRSDLQPWVDTGKGANSLLSRYLGVGGVGSSGRTSLGLSTGLSPTELRAQLAGRFTRAGAAPAADPRLDPNNPAFDQRAFMLNRNAGPVARDTDPMMSGAVQQAPAPTVDEAGLQAAMDQYYREQEAQNAQAQSDPTYGSLLRAYRGGAEFDSGPAFSFTGKDLMTEPGYQFGLQQGQQGIDRAQAARGNFLSGAAIKEASRFNTDYAGTKFNEGFNRSLSTYGTNLSRRQNEWNTNLGAYNNNRNSIYNYLSGASGTGQASAAMVGANNQQVANSVGNNLMQAGNAQSAGIIGGSNALVSGINGAANAFNSSNNMNSAAGWNTMLANNNIGRSGNNYNGSSTSWAAPNYTNAMDIGY